MDVCIPEAPEGFAAWSRPPEALLSFEQPWAKFLQVSKQKVSDFIGQINRGAASTQMLGGQIRKKSLSCLEGKSMTPHRKTLFSVAPASNYFISYSDRLFELTRRPSKALALPCTLPPDRYTRSAAYRCAALGTYIPGDCWKTIDENLDFAYV